jgi:hypothetical protein
MPEKRITAYQRQVYQTRLQQIERDWAFYRTRFLINGEPPTWWWGVFAVGLTLIGGVLLIWAVRRLLSGEPVLLGALLLPFAMVVTGLYYAILSVVRYPPYRAAEQVYRRRRASLRLKDCSKQPEPMSAEEEAAYKRSAEEEAAGKMLLDAD